MSNPDDAVARAVARDSASEARLQRLHDVQTGMSPMEALKLEQIMMGALAYRTEDEQWFDAMASALRLLTRMGATRAPEVD